MKNSAKLGKFVVTFPNSTEFHQLKREIFSQHHYYLDKDFESPTIIDAGAHIGLSTLYFKQTWPTAKIIAIEPNPDTVIYLQENINTNQLTDITIEPVALSTQTGRISLYIDPTEDHWNSTASLHSKGWANTQPGKPISVPSVPLREFLQKPIDLLKMDIEGIEQDVLLATGSDIRQVKHMFVEFHGRSDNHLLPIVDFLTQHQFEVSVWQNGHQTDPVKVRGLAIIEGHQKNC